MTIELKKRNSGFTLVEMAIVLVIIGIILAGVMKGRDIVRGAQVKQFSQQFAQKWGTVAQTYYDKTGQFLNDGEVNGGVAAGAADGQMDGTMAEPVQAQNIIDILNGVGIPLCSIVKSKLVSPVAGVSAAATTPVCSDDGAGGNDTMNPWQTMVEGEFSGGTLVEVDLVNLSLTINGLNVLRNCVVLYNVPIDVAQGLDTAIDARNDGMSGSCVALTTAHDNDIAQTALDNTAVIDIATVGGWDNPTVTATACQEVGIILDY